MAAVGIAVFTAADLILALWHLPHAVTFPDSSSYLQVSFLGHSERLWVVPVLYRLSGSTTGRVIVQSVIGAGCWSCLAIQVGRSVARPVLAYLAGGVILLTALCAPVIEWDRAILSESLATSLTVMVFAAALAAVRHLDGRRLAWLLAATVAWAFTRQAQAFLVPLLALPLLGAALRPDRRRLALVGAAGMLIAGGWATLTSLQSGSDQITATNVDGIVLFRAAGTGELRYLVDHGMPLARGLQIYPPYTSAGLPVGVDRFGDSNVLAELLADPGLSAWDLHHGETTLIGYALDHPGASLGAPLRNGPRLMTMDPGYAPGPALPAWVSAVVYGSTSLRGTAFSGGGAASSSHPLWIYTLLGASSLLLIAAAFRRRLTPATLVAAGAVIFSAIWAVDIWNGSTAELPRLFLPAASLAHVALVALTAMAIDSLVPLTGRPSSENVGNSATR